MSDEKKKSNSLDMVFFMHSEDLGLGDNVRAALFEVPGQDFKSIQITVGEGDDAPKFNGIARIFNSGDVSGVNIDMISRDKETKEYGFVPGAPFASAQLYTTHRKDESKASFLSGRAFDEALTTEITAAGKDKNNELVKELRQKGSKITGSIARGHGLVNAKVGADKPKKKAAPAPSPAPQGASVPL